MKCPVDKVDMIVVEHEKIEIDHCLKCAGVWLDTGELELLVTTLKADGAPAQAAMLNPHEVNSKEGKRKCPVCGQKMHKSRLGESSAVLVDSCPRNHGLWFDAGELQQVLGQMEAPGTAAGKDIISFLGSAFQATHGTDAKK